MTHTEKSHHWTPSIIIMAIGAAMTVAAFFMGLGRAEIASVILFSGLMLILVDPRLGIMCCFAYLALMGDLRRLIYGNPSVDPMLLVGPIWTAALLIRAFVSGLIRFDTPMAKMVTVLVALMAVQIFNPKQGGFAAGFAGAVIDLVPLCWYFIGRAFGDGKFTRMVLWRVLIPVAGAGAILGMYQTFYGFLGFERHWIATSGYTALLVQRSVRPFGFFVSAAEYALFLSMSSVVLIATLIGRRPRWGYLLILLPFLLIALFLESSRTPIALLIAASCAMWGATAATNTGAVVRMGLALGMMVGILALGLTHLSDVDLPQNVQPLIDHTKEGLLDPAHSTATGHATLFKQGIVDGLKNPLGEGIGSTIAAAKYGGENRSSEVDISDMFVCLGLGGVLYAAFVVVGLTRAVRHFREIQTITALATVGMLVASLGMWIYGSMYAAAPILCFLLGTTDPSPQEESLPQQPFPTRFRVPVRPAEPVPPPGRGAVPNFRRPQTFP